MINFTVQSNYYSSLLFIIKKLLLWRNSMYFQTINQKHTNKGILRKSQKKPSQTKLRNRQSPKLSTPGDRLPRASRRRRTASIN